MSNVIPRTFNSITVEQVRETNGGKVGDVWQIVRNAFGELIGTNTRTDERYHFFASHLRMPEFYRFISVERG